MWALLLLWEKKDNNIDTVSSRVYLLHYQAYVFFSSFSGAFFDLSTQSPLSLVSFSAGWLLTSEEALITSALASQYVPV